eukprot:1149323-Pelagomonas_calceolata.AAC.2
MAAGSTREASKGKLCRQRTHSPHQRLYKAKASGHHECIRVHQSIMGAMWEWWQQAPQDNGTWAAWVYGSALWASVMAAGSPKHWHQGITGVMWLKWQQALQNNSTWAAWLPKCLPHACAILTRHRTQSAFRHTGTCTNRHASYNQTKRMQTRYWL